jgi:uncharacterized protein YndB with AHSA1/START domain
MNKIIHLSIILNCDARRAFTFFTDNKSIESWLTAKAEVEPKAGGKYELFWEPLDRENNSTVGCKVTAVEKDKFISFEWKSPKQFKHFANNTDPLTHLTVFFIPLEDSTEVNLIHTGWRGSPDWEEARQWQINAWSIAFQQLSKIINGH